MQQYMILVPVLVLFVLGLGIALRSGAVASDPGDGMLSIMAGNFSSLVVRVFGYLAALMLVQHVIGFRRFPGW
jgi:hypothetical protein